MAENDKIKLEDLLKLKRAERPSSEDWLRFDEELKNKLYMRAVNKPSLAQRLLGSLPAKSIALGGAASAAFAFAVYFNSNAGAQQDIAYQAKSEAVEASKTPLPGVRASYAVNVLPSESQVAETPVFAQISGENDSVRYVSNGQELSGSFAF